MEVFLLATLVIKKHRRSHRRLTLGLHKHWVACVSKQRLQGRLALPCPIQAIHLYYHMDRQVGYWAVLGQLKGKTLADHAPHPLSYSGFSLVVEPTNDKPPHYSVPSPDQRAESWQETQRYWVSVEFSHRTIDGSVERYQGQDFRSLIWDPEYYRGVAAESSLFILHQSGYTLRSYLKLQYEVLIDGSIWRLVLLESGLFPVPSFQPSVVLRTFLGLCGNPQLHHYWNQEFSPPTDTVQALSAVCHVIRYFETQEQFESQSILKRTEAGSDQDSARFTASMKVVLQMKLDHLACLNSAILHPLAQLVGCLPDHRYGKLGQMASSASMVARIKAALQSETIPAREFTAICEVSLSAYYPAYYDWWLCLFQNLPGDSTARLHQDLATPDSADVWDSNWPRNSVKGNWSAKINYLTHWILLQRGIHAVNKSCNSDEQDHQYLGSTGSKDLAPMFLPKCGLFYGRGLSTSTFYHQNKVVCQDIEYDGPRNNDPITEEFTPDTHEIFKLGYQLRIVVRPSGLLKWDTIPMKDLNLQTIFRFRNGRCEEGCSSVRESANLVNRVGQHNSFDSGVTHLIALSRAENGKSCLISIQLAYKGQISTTLLSNLLPTADFAAFENDRDYHMKHVHDNKRVFPLAIFDEDQLVLAAQLSIREVGESASKPLDVGIQMYAFRHSVNQQFSLLTADRHHATWAFREELRPSAITLGWDTSRLCASRFWFRWRELAAYKVGIWVTGHASYSLHAFKRNRFFPLVRKRLAIDSCKHSTMLMQCKLGAEQPSVGISSILGVFRDYLRVGCWLFRLKI